MSDPANSAFCSTMLRLARLDAKKYGVKIPPLTAANCGLGWFDVYARADKGTDIVWCGDADNASEAKANAIGVLMHRAGIDLANEPGSDALYFDTIEEDTLRRVDSKGRVFEGDIPTNMVAVIRLAGTNWEIYDVKAKKVIGPTCATRKEAKDWAINQETN